MRTINKGLGLSALIFVVFLTLSGSSYALGPSAVDLGSAGDFAILSKAGVTNVPMSSITGDVGSSPITGTAIGLECTEVTGNIYSVDAAGPAPCSIADPTRLTAAIGDMQTAYTNAAGRPADVTELGAGDISGRTLTPGTYKWGTGLLITSDVTLSGGANDVWILQIAEDLTVSNGVKVQLTGGAQAKNVFWQVGGQATIGTTAAFSGVILSQTAISMQTGASINGNLFAQTEVTLQSNAVTKPSAAAVTTPVDTGADNDDSDVTPDDNVPNCAPGWHQVGTGCAKDSVAVQPIDETPVNPGDENPVITDVSPTGADIDSSTDDSTGNRMWLWGILALAIIGGVVAFFVMRKK
jgi:hypothetical protein